MMGSLRRISAVASNTFLEAVRQKVLPCFWFSVWF